MKHEKITVLIISIAAVIIAGVVIFLYAKGAAAAPIATAPAAAAPTAVVGQIIGSAATTPVSVTASRATQQVIGQIPLNGSQLNAALAATPGAPAPATVITGAITHLAGTVNNSNAAPVQQTSYTLISANTLAANDIVSACLTLLAALPAGNYNIPAFNTQLTAISNWGSGNPIQANTSVANFNTLAGTLWNNLATFFLSQTKGWISNFQDQGAKTTFAANLTTLLNTTAMPGYNHLNFATGLLNLWYASNQELLLEACVNMDKVLYQPYASESDYYAGTGVHYAVFDTWEQTKWQQFKILPTILTVVPSQVVASLGASAGTTGSGTDSNGVYLTWNGNRLYQYQTLPAAIAGYNAFYTGYTSSQRYVTTQANISNLSMEIKAAVGFVAAVAALATGNYPGLALAVYNA